MEADPVCQPRRVADKRTPLDITRAAHVETTRLPSGHTNTVTTRIHERLPTPVHGYRGRQPHNGHGVTPKRRGRGSERRDPYHHATRRGTTTSNGCSGDGSGTTEANDEGTTSAAILARRRDTAGAGLDDAEPRTRTTTGLHRRGGEAKGHLAAAMPEEETATADAPARRHKRLGRYSGGNATGRRGGRTSGSHRTKRRAGRGRGGGCDSEDGDSTTCQCTGEEGEAAGGG
uniref:Pr1-like protein n=1 Tax=Oryza sativa subsp. japonica TaxID=39947 RepID=Q5VN24_ORYSJ|nr:pr1-like protein [Oryza sativa Japonica Group]